MHLDLCHAGQEYLLEQPSGIACRYLRYDLRLLSPLGPCFGCCNLCMEVCVDMCVDMNRHMCINTELVYRSVY